MTMRRARDDYKIQQADGGWKNRSVDMKTVRSDYKKSTLARIKSKRRAGGDTDESSSEEESKTDDDKSSGLTETSEFQGKEEGEREEEQERKEETVFRLPCSSVSVKRARSQTERQQRIEQSKAEARLKPCWT